MEVLGKPVNVVWMTLMGATCVSTWMLSQDGVTPAVAAIGILLIAAAKVHLVMQYFMELRVAPLAVRSVFASWIVASTAVILVGYLATS